jgi:hypothetical protein
MQGKNPKRPRDDQQRQVQPPERPWAAPQAAQLDLVDSWDDAGPFPHAKDVAAAAALAPSSLSIARRALVFIGAAMGVATIAFAIISSLPRLWRDFGKDTTSNLLLAFTGVAVFTWCLAQLVTAVRRQAAPGSAKRTWSGAIRNALATAILLPTAGTAYLEWSAYAQSSRALNAVNVKWNDSAPPTRQEVETLIGRTAEDVSPGAMSHQSAVTYRWRGVFRTYVLRAKYLWLRHNMGDPRAMPAKLEEGFETLYWISDVLE